MLYAEPYNYDWIVFESAEETKSDQCEVKQGCYVRTEKVDGAPAKYLAYVLMRDIIPRTEKLIGI